MDGPGGVAPAGPDLTLPLPSETRLNVGDGQGTGGKQEGRVWETVLQENHQLPQKNRNVYCHTSRLESSSVPFASQ